MPFRKTILANNQHYHILNRGVAGSLIFNNTYDYRRFIELISFYRYDNLPLSFSRYSKLPLDQKEEFNKRLEEKGELLVELFSYCLMPNHFHLQAKQTKENGVQKFLANLQNSYAKYYNTKHERYGPLFQSRFKAKIIHTDEIMLHISRYIHLNPVSSYLIDIKELSSYAWSSLPYYLDGTNTSFVNTKYLLDIAGGRKKYKSFIYNQADYQRRLQNVRHLLLEK